MSDDMWDLIAYEIMRGRGDVCAVYARSKGHELCRDCGWDEDAHNPVVSDE